jgi:hypothetical protein
METMILVAGLAIAGLAGIAAAFYFSMRPGGSRVRPTVASRAGASRSPAGRNRSPRAVQRTGPSTVIDFTGPQRILEDPEPQVTTGRRARHGDRPDAAADEPGPGRRAARRAAEADSDDGPQMPKSWRRVAWRKGSDVDEELWPAASFGGVSDEQFWDDLASDKPLATTARPAQADAAARPTPRQRGPLPELRPGAGRAPMLGNSAHGASAEGPSTNPQPRLAPDDRTAIQPAVPPPASPTSPMATQPYPMATSATQPVRAAYQAPEPRGRSRTSPGADEDPLTSPAYSLRPKGRVDGRGGYPGSVPPARQPGRPSYGPNGQARPDQQRPEPQRSEPQRSEPLRPADPYAAYPYPQQPYDERQGSPNPSGPRPQAGPAGDPRQANGGSRPAYPPVNGHRGPYNPQGYDRRLTITF